MDRKSILILAASFALLMAWYPLVNRWYPPAPLPKSTNAVSQATNGVRSLTAGEPATNRVPEVNRLPPALSRALPLAETAEQLVVVENEQARYTFTSHGGGLKRVELKQYPERVGSQRRSTLSNTNSATLNRRASLPVLALLGGTDIQGDGVFLLSRTGTGVRAEKKLTNGLIWVKEFRLETNYLVDAVARLENRGTQMVHVPEQEWVVGASTPISSSDNNPIMLGAADYNGSKANFVGEAWFANRSMGGCLPGTPRALYQSGTNILWAAVYNQFFTLAVIPTDPALRMEAHPVDLPPPSAAEIAADAKTVLKPTGIESTLIFPSIALAPNQSLERRFSIYAGPKEYNTLARLGAAFKNDLDLVMHFGGFFGFFAKLLLLSMNGLHALNLGYGLAIIVITVIIKLLFWPLTNASTRSMKRMAALQPQMKQIQEKYKEDPKKMNLKLMEFMKENKVSPVSGCVPMLLQIPVFFGFYTMLQGAIELRGAHFLWATDLSTADTVWVIPGFGFPLNPLPLIMGVTMLWQARMTPPSPGMDPMQQKIMKYMPLMFMVFLYNFSAGLTLYWTVQNLLTIAQMKVTKGGTSPVGPTPKGPAPRPAPGRRKA
jgi:YidC/Oxa1 family membrane protein insertase